MKLTRPPFISTQLLDNIIQLLTYDSNNSVSILQDSSDSVKPLIGIVTAAQQGNSSEFKKILLSCACWSNVDVMEKVTSLLFKENIDFYTTTYEYLITKDELNVDDLGIIDLYVRSLDKALVPVQDDLIKKILNFNPDNWDYLAMPEYLLDNKRTLISHIKNKDLKHEIDWNDIALIPYFISASQKTYEVQEEIRKFIDELKYHGISQYDTWLQECPSLNLCDKTYMKITQGEYETCITIDIAWLSHQQKVQYFLLENQLQNYFFQVGDNLKQGIKFPDELFKIRYLGYSSSYHMGKSYVEIAINNEEKIDEDLFKAFIEHMTSAIVLKIKGELNIDEEYPLNDIKALYYKKKLGQELNNKNTQKQKIKI